MGRGELTCLLHVLAQEFRVASAELHFLGGEEGDSDRLICVCGR